MSKPEKLIPLHGGYRKLKSFQVALDGKAECRMMNEEVKVGNQLCL
jgi:hypothetical protein